MADKKDAKGNEPQPAADNRSTLQQVGFQRRGRQEPESTRDRSWVSPTPPGPNIVDAAPQKITSHRSLPF